MSTNPLLAAPPDLDDPAVRAADAAAVLGHLTDCGPLDPAVVNRVRARAERVTEGVRQARDVIDDATFRTLLDDES